ncbi:GRP family sugar transporter [Lapidilactobacillus luobeiensis]|uniref:GRP family sugar transporter n=1 Tax=Lapidilactobacillus luobeiensis TaxID=2950371 RepID=UPI0021C37BF6|nr:GRP family sugar transporter [Lapidilactobacillus luobeiensis]
MIAFLLYLSPALGWGLMPISAKKCGGNPRQQLLGTTISAFIIAMIISLIFQITFSWVQVIVSLLSGFCWGLGQLFQFIALREGDVSVIMPFSSGSQLVFTTLASGLLLGEWRGAANISLALLAVLLAVVGVVLISKSDQGKRIELKDLAIVLLSSLFLCAYATITKFFKIPSAQIFLPQALGMLTISLGLFFLDKEQRTTHFVKTNLLTGLLWGIANFGLFYSANRIGMSLAYTISQFCLVITIFSGILVLKESKTRNELVHILIGIVLFILAITLLSSLS